MKDVLTPGTLCFLVRLRLYPEFSGRVVEVIERVPTPDDESPTDEWWSYCAPWAADEFPGAREFTVRRCNLLPITAPRTELHHQTTSEA